MQTRANTLEKQPRLYAIEFLRIFFVFFIILGHIMEMYPEVKTNVLAFLHTKEMNTWFGVEFFFIIGGFFLYKRIQIAPSNFELIKKIYIRLMPALLFVFLVCLVWGTNNPKLYFSKFPLVLTLTAALGFSKEATGWGDWYVCTYFWCCLLFIGLFSNNLKQGFLWTALLSYFTLCLKVSAPYEGWMKTYYTIIGNEFIRGVYSMGLGITAAYLSDKARFADKKVVSIFFTIREAYCFVAIFNYIARASHNRFSFFEMEIIFALLLICIENSLGYITSYLNKFSKIQLISKYTYSILLCHIPCMSILWSHDHYCLAGTTCGFIVTGGSHNGNF